MSYDVINLTFTFDAIIKFISKDLKKHFPFFYRVWSWDKVVEDSCLSEHDRFENIYKKAG